MFNLITVELTKIVSKKSTKIAIIIAGILIIFSCIFQASSEVTPKNWREEVQKEVDFAKNEIKENKGTDMEDFYETLYKEDVAIGEYSLEHNIANNVITPLKFAYNNTFSMSVWVVLLLIMSVINFADEFQFGTIKQILTRPYKRSKILMAKQIVFVCMSIVVLLIQIAISYIVGLIFFGKNGTSGIVLDYVNGNVIEINMNMTLWQLYFSYVVVAIILISIAYFFITIMRTATIPIILTMLIWLGDGLITSTCSKYQIIKYTIFPHLNLAQYIKGNDLMLKGNTIGFSCAVLLISFVVVEICTYIVFTKRDI